MQFVGAKAKGIGAAMSARRETVKFSVFQVGELTCAAEVRNAIDLANQTQEAFRFTFHDRRFHLDERYRLKNGGYNLDQAISGLAKRHRLPLPTIFVTSQPYSDHDSQNDPNGFFFSEFHVGDDILVVSTYPWDVLPGERRAQPYMLFTLASIGFDRCAAISIHYETRGCPFDYCDVPSDIDRAFQATLLCSECSRQLDRSLRKGRATLEQAGASVRLLNRAAGRKQAFVAMPFCAELDPVFFAIRGLLEGANCRYIRADDVTYPRSITDAIIYSILASDLIIADVTGNNPNVFYELGWAHAMNQDVIILTQEDKIPFDVTTERAIKYKGDEGGIKDLLRRMSRTEGIPFP